MDRHSSLGTQQTACKTYFRWTSKTISKSRHLRNTFRKTSGTTSLIVSSTIHCASWTCSPSTTSGQRSTSWAGWQTSIHTLIRRVADHGHELASHSYWHQLVYEMTPDSFRADLRRSKTAIEDAASLPVTNYRAPSFSDHAGFHLGTRRFGGRRVYERFQHLSHRPRSVWHPRRSNVSS